jgi:hypothetical protein
MKLAQSAGDILRTWVAYSLAQQIQSSTSLRWMDHAPIYMDVLYRCWHDAEASARPEVCTIAQADTLRRNPELQQCLCNYVDEEMRLVEDILEFAEQRGDADTFFNMFNQSVRKAMARIMPLLRVVHRNFGSPDLTRCEEEFCAERRKWCAAARRLEGPVTAVPNTLTVHEEETEHDLQNWNERERDLLVSVQNFESNGFFEQSDFSFPS